MNFFSIKKRKEALFSTHVKESRDIRGLLNQLDNEINSIHGILYSRQGPPNCKEELEKLYQQALTLHSNTYYSPSFGGNNRAEWLLISITTLRLVRELYQPYMEVRLPESALVNSLSLLNTPNDYYETKVKQLTFSVIALASVAILIPTIGFPPVLAVCFAITVAAALILTICDLQKQSNQSYDIVKPITDAALKYVEESLSLDKKSESLSW